VLDRRVTSKYYGKQFLASLPGGNEVRGRRGEIKDATAKWLGVR
jgi:hypothetical protein